MSGTRHGIVVEGVWKKFRRGEQHDSLRDLLPALVRRAFRPEPSGDALAKDWFWALRELSFTVNPGEALGIIGANGAGKSTALKVLTRILRPTRGTIAMTGRVGALIEVSAGFHYDLTGRENVYLQGAIMGMPTRLIRDKFDQIVEFSGIESFIDTPVKRYSTGMTARLGFSVAAHLDPDVLIVDEVLAVGDFRFQQRAYGRIKELATSGIPVVVVSHQLDRVAELCTQALLLDKGRVAARGTPAECIAAYVEGHSAVDDGLASERGVVLRSVKLLSGDTVVSGAWLTVRIEGEAARVPGESIDPVELRLRSLENGQVVFVSSMSKLGVAVDRAGPFTVEVMLQANLTPGRYLLETAVFDRVKLRNAGAGPSTLIQVTDSADFAGTAQLNARMRVVPPHSGPSPS